MTKGCFGNTASEVAKKTALKNNCQTYLKIISGIPAVLEVRPYKNRNNQKIEINAQNPRKQRANF
jgi:hypothetical protein